MIRFVGLDVHKRIVEVCILDPDGKVLARHRFALTRESLKAFATKTLTLDVSLADQFSSNELVCPD